MTRSLRLVLALAVGAIVGLPACGDADSDRAAAPAAKVPYRVISAGDLAPGADVPAPRGKVVLSLRGAITHTNAAGRLDFDLPTLERLGLVQWTSSDKIATGARATFRGVLLERLLEVAGVRPGARTLRTSALNDYRVDIPVRDARTWPVLVATRTNGKRMGVATYGPTRIVYPYGLYPDLDPTTHDPRSIWQLARITVR